MAVAQTSNSLLIQGGLEIPRYRTIVRMSPGFGSESIEGIFKYRTIEIQEQESGDQWNKWNPEK